MKRGTFLILVMMVWWLWLIIWSFFGWKSNGNPTDQPQIPQSSDTWFESNLTNTWNTQEPSTTPTGINETLKKKYTDIRLIMPKYFYTPERKDFANDLYSWEKIHINFVFINDLNQYRDTLSNKNFSEADIVLFPYDRSELVKIQTFSFQKSLKPAFDDWVWDIIEDWNTPFLPFAADPMIMYMLPGYTLTGFSDISNFAYDREPQKPMSFPIFFWITDEDYYNKWFSREYQDIMRYALLHYFTVYNNKTNEEILSARVNSNAFENYDVSNLNAILNRINISECKHFPSICFQLYDLVWLRFGFLSDADIVQTYFQTKESKFTELQKLNFPFYDTEVPVRVRWRAIPESVKDIDTINAVYRFLVKYMNSGKEYDLRNSTLPVFKPEEWTSIINHPFVWFRWYILTTWWNFMEKLKATRPFRQLLDYEITAAQYLKRA